MSKGRLEAFSDGVVAILITIMVLELKVPHGADGESLRPRLWRVPDRRIEDKLHPLEAVSKPLLSSSEFPRANESGGQVMKSLEVFAEFLVADLQAPVLAEPRERSLDHVAEATQPAAVLLVLSSQEADDATLQGGRDVGGRTIGTITLKAIWSMARASSRPLDFGNVVQQFDGRDAIVHVGRRGANDQWDAVGIRDHMPLAALFSSVCRVGAGVGPPKTARTEALSMTARDQSICPNRPRASRSFWWTVAQTPFKVHSRKRRQHVTPSPQPNSGGSMFQGIPVFNTKMIPARQARSATRGLPPSGLGWCTGRSGSISDQSSSGTNDIAMESPSRFHGSYRHSGAVTGFETAS